MTSQYNPTLYCDICGKMNFFVDDLKKELGEILKQKTKKARSQQDKNNINAILLTIKSIKELIKNIQVCEECSKSAINIYRMPLNPDEKENERACKWITQLVKEHKLQTNCAKNKQYCEQMLKACSSFVESNATYPNIDTYRKAKINLQYALINILKTAENRRANYLKRKDKEDLQKSVLSRALINTVPKPPA